MTVEKKIVVRKLYAPCPLIVRGALRAGTFRRDPPDSARQVEQCGRYRCCLSVAVTVAAYADHLTGLSWSFLSIYRAAFAEHISANVRREPQARNACKEPPPLLLLPTPYSLSPVLAAKQCQTKSRLPDHASCWLRTIARPSEFAEPHLDFGSLQPPLR